MTAQEAIKRIKETPLYRYEVCLEEKRQSDLTKALLLAIEALEKQIPKKILYIKQNYGTPWLCCECEADQTPTEFMSADGSEPKEKHTFCWKCGQKLDWSEQNERT